VTMLGVRGVRSRTSTAGGLRLDRIHLRESARKHRVHNMPKVACGWMNEPALAACSST
jgi:hypothetical protein